MADRPVPVPANQGNQVPQPARPQASGPVPPHAVPQPRGAGSAPPPAPRMAAQVAQSEPQQLPPDVEAEVAQPVGFWQHPFIQDVAPFITSVVAHVAIIVGALLILPPVRNAISKAVKEQISVASASIDNSNDGGVPNPGLSGDPTRAAQQNKFPDVPANSSGIASNKGPALVPTAAPGGGSGDASDTISTAGGGPGFGRGSGGGRGDGLGGNGTGDGTGALAPFGVPGGGGGGLTKGLFQGGGGAHKVIYVCDASGSMMTTFDQLRAEIRRSVDSLQRSQEFNVIFFQEFTNERGQKMDKVPLSPAGLLRVNSENRHKLADFLGNISPQQTTNPIPALELAFQQQPELIFLLTDGDFVDNDAVINRCRELNKDKKVRISTIAYISRGDTYEKVLKQIADDSGGTFKFVAEEELGR